MMNDRFGNGSRNDLNNRFRNKKFVSTVAIGIFVLILLIVLVVKGCSPKKTAPASTLPQVQVQNPAVEAPAPTDDEYAGGSAAIRQSTEETEGMRLFKEGLAYKNGDGGRPRDYKKAYECFLGAEKLGVKGAAQMRKICEQKLPKKRK